MFIFDIKNKTIVIYITKGIISKIFHTIVTIPIFLLPMLQIRTVTDHRMHAYIVIQDGGRMFWSKRRGKTCGPPSWFIMHAYIIIQDGGPHVTFASSP